LDKNFFCWSDGHRKVAGGGKERGEIMMKQWALYLGESTCVGAYANGATCKKTAYFEGGYCGTHKRSAKKLPKNPNAASVKKQAIDAHLATVVPSENPVVTATKMRMRRTPVPAPGHYLVCPNNKHASNFGHPGDYSSLSPMRLGPVAWTPEGNALNIENFHQFAKCFPKELSDQPCTECGYREEHNKPSEAFYETRKRGYADPTPHRHKFSAKDGNAPAFSVQFDEQGREHHYSYVQSRYFYCKQMELLATEREAFRQLVSLRQQGYSLDIHGYDAYTPTGTDADTLYAHYCDPSRPFGHEMVILTLLVLEPDQYPWDRFRRENADIYQGFPEKRRKI
jgi:hypothetical protein